MKRGAAYVAIGEKAKREAQVSQGLLLEHNPGLEITVYEDDLPRVEPHKAAVPMSRKAKLTMFDWCPYDQVLYIDADTRPMASAAAGFDILEDGWDLAIVPSSAQGSEFLWNLREEEREATLKACGTWVHPLVLQAGIFFVARNDRTRALFAAWLEEWARRQDMDQGALLRAYYRSPVKVWLLGEAWNSAHRRGDRVFDHYFGKARTMA